MCLMYARLLFDRSGLMCKMPRPHFKCCQDGRYHHFDHMLIRFHGPFYLSWSHLAKEQYQYLHENSYEPLPAHPAGVLLQLPMAKVDRSIFRCNFSSLRS